MSYFIRIFCRASTPLTRASLVAFIVDGVFFEAGPRFSPDDAATLGEREWSKLSLEYSPSKRPIVFSRNFADDLVAEEVSEMLERLSANNLQNAVAFEYVRNTTQVFAIEVDQEHLTDEAWELVDAVEHYVATELDGIIYAPDDGIFDKDLKKIVSVP